MFCPCHTIGTVCKCAVIKCPLKACLSGILSHVTVSAVPVWDPTTTYLYKLEKLASCAFTVLL